MERPRERSTKSFHGRHRSSGAPCVGDGGVRRKRWKEPTFDPTFSRRVHYRETDFPAHNPPGWRFPWSIAAISFGVIAAFFLLLWLVELLGG
jgi:hypothetical protein